jgi:zinc-binding alcohol dehydrogenase/oxidoreductase
MGTRDEFMPILDLLESIKIKSVIDKVYPLEDINEAMQRIESGDQFGKIILQIN